MKTVYFKNGDTRQITLEEFKGIIKGINKLGKDADWWIGSTEESPYVLINLNEINYIK